LSLEFILGSFTLTWVCCFKESLQISELKNPRFVRLYHYLWTYISNRILLIYHFFWYLVKILNICLFKYSLNLQR